MQGSRRDCFLNPRVRGFGVQRLRASYPLFLALRNNDLQLYGLLVRRVRTPFRSTGSILSDHCGSRTLRRMCVPPQSSYASDMRDFNCLPAGAYVFQRRRLLLS